MNIRQKILSTARAVQIHTIGYHEPGTEVPTALRAGWGWECDGCQARGNDTPTTALPTRQAATAAFGLHRERDTATCPKRRVTFTTFPVAKNS